MGGAATRLTDELADTLQHVEGDMILSKLQIVRRLQMPRRVLRAIEALAVQGLPTKAGHLGAEVDAASETALVPRQRSRRAGDGEALQALKKSLGLGRRRPGLSADATPACACDSGKGGRARSPCHSPRARALERTRRFDAVWRCGKRLQQPAAWCCRGPGVSEGTVTVRIHGWMARKKSQHCRWQSRWPDRPSLRSTYIAYTRCIYVLVLRTYLWFATCTPYL